MVIFSGVKAGFRCIRGIALAYLLLAVPAGAVMPGENEAGAEGEAKRPRLMPGESVAAPAQGGAAAPAQAGPPAPAKVRLGALPEVNLQGILEFLPVKERAALGRASKRTQRALNRMKGLGLDARKVKDPGGLAIYLARHGAQVEALDLSGCSWVDDHWGPLLRGLPALRSLDLSHCPQVTDLLLGNLPVGLKKLNLSGCRQVTDAGMVLINRLALDELNLLDCSITNRGLGNLAPLHLRSLALSWSRPNSAWDGQGLAHLAADRLRVLELDLDDEVDDEALGALLPRARKLEQLTLLDGTVGNTARMLGYLKGLPLRSLSLDRGDIDDQAMEHLAGLPLERLTLTALPGVKGNGVVFLHRCPLKELVLDTCEELSEKDLAPTLAGLASLQILRLRDNSPNEMSGKLLASLPRQTLKELYLTAINGLTDEELAVLRGMPLQKLELEAPLITEAGLACLEGMPLQSLSLDHAASLTGGLKALQGMPLGELQLKGCTGLTDAALASLGALRTLHTLTLEEDAGIGDAGLAALENLRLTSLDLTRCPGITDAGLARIAGMPLRELYLAGTAITDAGLGPLRNLPLETLSLSGCQHITGEGFGALLAMPLRLLWLMDLPNLTDQGLLFMGQMPALEELRMAGCPRVNPALRGLVKLKNGSAIFF
jgi:hypothetical protein